MYETSESNPATSSSFKSGVEEEGPGMVVNVRNMGTIPGIMLLAMSDGSPPDLVTSRRSVGSISNRFRLTASFRMSTFLLQLCLYS